MSNIILAIETSSELCSVALLCERVYQQVEHSPQGHARLLLPMIDRVISEANISLKDIDFLAFSQGPGSFTGLRTGISVVQGLAYALDKKLIAVPSLHALALSAAKNTGKSRFIPMLDARMGEVYWSDVQVNIISESEFVLSENIESTVSNPKVIADLCEHNIPLSEKKDSPTLIGVGARVYADSFYELVQSAKISLNTEILFPHAQEVAQLANTPSYLNQATNYSQAKPLYVRNPEFKISTNHE